MMALLSADVDTYDHNDNNDNGNDDDDDDDDDDDYNNRVCLIVYTNKYQY